MSTTIEWTDTVWNPVRGCSMADGSEVKLAEPLTWRKPRKCFVNSMSDLFHEALPFEHIAAVFGIMAACPHITFQVLTKRPERALDFYAWLLSMPAAPPGLPAPAWRPEGFCRPLSVIAAALFRQPVDLSRDIEFRGDHPWPLPNVWLGTSVENQETADRRVPILLKCPAAVRFLSYEPALGPVDFDQPECERHGKEFVAEGPDVQPWCSECDTEASCGHWLGEDGGLDWIICGGESGPGARPMHPDWARAVRNQCQEAGVPFFFKQHGEWADLAQTEEASGWTFTRERDGRRYGRLDLHSESAFDGREFETRYPWEDRTYPCMVKVGKHRAGRLLDGREWSEFPRGAKR